ncbi:MAG: hypothetical protein AB1656_05615 [Candidatus Omnitrophota bacterium]
MPKTSLTVIALNLLVMNLGKLYRLAMEKGLFAGLLAWWKRMKETSGWLWQALSDLAAVQRRRGRLWAAFSDWHSNGAAILRPPLPSLRYKFFSNPEFLYISTKNAGGIVRPRINSLR